MGFQIAGFGLPIADYRFWIADWRQRNGLGVRNAEARRCRERGPGIGNPRLIRWKPAQAGSTRCWNGELSSATRVSSDELQFGAGWKGLGSSDRLPGVGSC